MAEHEAQQQEIRDRLNEAVRDGRLPDWVGEGRPVDSRQALREQMQGSHDIAAAAEALIDEGAIGYDQATPHALTEMARDAGLPHGLQGDEDAIRFEHELGRYFIGNSGAGDILFGTRGNCYDFVHLAALVAADEDGQPHTGCAIQNVVEKGTLKEWDFKSPIPRGNVIVGCVGSWAGGQGSDNTYHFAVSLGNGMVASNRDEGPKQEPIDDVFGGFFSWYRMPGGKVYYGSYACYADKSVSPAAAAVLPKEGMPNPRSAAEMQGTLAKAGLGVAGATVLLIAILAVLLTRGEGEAGGQATGAVASPSVPAAAAAVQSPSPVATDAPALAPTQAPQPTEAPTEVPTGVPPTEAPTQIVAVAPTSPPSPVPTNPPPTPEPQIDPAGSYSLTFTQTDGFCNAFPTSYQDTWVVTQLGPDQIRIVQQSNGVLLTGSFDPVTGFYNVSNPSETATGFFGLTAVDAEYSYAAPQCPEKLIYGATGAKN
jgi:hypothetical protein